MDLNHARLPIPPRWQVDLHCNGGHKAADQEDLHPYSTDATPPVKPSPAIKVEFPAGSSNGCAKNLHLAVLDARVPGLEYLSTPAIPGDHR
jgi:hypothetical protein